MVSIEIDVAQGLSEEDYIKLAGDIKNAIECLNSSVVEINDGMSKEEDLIKSVSLVERTEIVFEESEE